MAAMKSQKLACIRPATITSSLKLSYRPQYFRRRIDFLVKRQLYIVGTRGGQFIRDV